MTAKDFVAFLRRTDDSPEIQKLLTDLGVAKRPRLKRGELYAYVQLPKKGLVLVFRESHDPKTSQLALVDVQIFSSAKKGYSTYAGELPDGLTFSDTRDITAKRLGQPSESDGNEDTWQRKGYNLIVQYNKDTGHAQMLHLAVPVG